MLVILVIVLGIVVFLSVKGKDAGVGANVNDENMDAEQLEKWQEGVITHDGKDYIYNQDIKAYLIMGVDKNGEVKEASSYTKGGQSDAMFLLVTDASAQKMSVVSIHRNTMTRIEFCDATGKSAGYKTAQICLQHANGDGKNLSCVRAADAVSYLFYNLPISGYLAMNMDGMPIMNDAIGGVEVKIHEGDILPARFKPGTTVLLKGDDVENYVRTRNIDWTTNGALDSNNNRMERQRQYMMNFIQKVLQMTNEDISTPLNLFNIARKGQYIITNLNVSRVTYLTTVLSRINFTEESFQTIPGEVVAGEKYAEYHVDDEALYQMILDTFYTKE